VPRQREHAAAQISASRVHDCFCTMHNNKCGVAHVGFPAGGLPMCIGTMQGASTSLGKCLVRVTEQPCRAAMGVRTMLTRSEEEARLCTRSYVDAVRCVEGCLQKARRRVDRDQASRMTATDVRILKRHRPNLRLLKRGRVSHGDGCRT
jgi:hypothetical protein